MVFWLPFGLDVDFTSWLSFILDWEPLVDAVAKSQSAKLGGARSDVLIFANIVVPDVVVEFVAQIVNFDVEVFVVPFWTLASISVSR